MLPDLPDVESRYPPDDLHTAKPAFAGATSEACGLTSNPIKPQHPRIITTMPIDRTTWVLATLAAATAALETIAVQQMRPATR